VDGVRYLGIHLGAGLSFAGHVEKAVNKAKSAAGVLLRTVRGTWKLGRGKIKSVYPAVCLGILGYGIRVWGQCIGNAHIKRKLLSAQRSFLLLLTGACRTVSNDALQVLAGRPPIDLELAGRMANYAIGVNRCFNLLGITFQPIAFNMENENMRPHLVLEAKRLLRERIHQLWQDRWSSSPLGRITHGWVDDVGFATDHVWFRPGYRVSTLMTGHGLGMKLHSLGLVDDPTCVCGEGIETWEHVLFRCSLYEQPRIQLTGKVGVVWLQNFKELIKCKENFDAFRLYAEEVFTIRGIISDRHLLNQGEN
jgi:hypothetical protein